MRLRTAAPRPSEPRTRRQSARARRRSYPGTGADRVVQPAGVLSGPESRSDKRAGFYAEVWMPHGVTRPPRPRWGAALLRRPRPLGPRGRRDSSLGAALPRHPPVTDAGDGRAHLIGGGRLGRRVPTADGQSPARDRASPARRAETRGGTG